MTAFLLIKYISKVNLKYKNKSSFYMQSDTIHLTALWMCTQSPVLLQSWDWCGNVIIIQKYWSIITSSWWYFFQTLKELTAVSRLHTMLLKALSPVKCLTFELDPHCASTQWRHMQSWLHVTITEYCNAISHLISSVTVLQCWIFATVTAIFSTST